MGYFYIDPHRNITYNPHLCKLYIISRGKKFMARYRIFYWKHIPSSIVVEGDGRTVKKQLSQKIQNKIDAYAMATGVTTTNEYSAQYRRGEWTEREGTPEEIAEAVVAELEAEFAKIEIPRQNGQ
jgi:hypothetical protein